MNYTMPNWIRPPDIASEYAKGVAIGQQAAQESQRLAMQQEENQRQHLMEQQRLQVEKSFKDQQLSMQKQELDQATQLNALKVRETAGYLDARAKYNQCIQSGGNAADCLFKYGPGMDAGTLSGYASLIKMNQPAFVPSEQTTTQGTRTIQTSPGHYQVIKPPKQPTSAEEDMGAYAKRSLPKAIADLQSINIGDPEIYDNSVKLADWQKKRNKVDTLQRAIKGKPVALNDIKKRAHAAIAAGAPEDKVKARYKQVTGEDLDASTDSSADEDTEE